MGELNEGEELFLPCKHCTSVTLAIHVRPGQREVICRKCQGTTRIRVRKESKGFHIAAQSMDLRPRT